MKLKTTLFTLFTLLFLYATAHANYWTLDPVESLDTSIGDVLDVELKITAEGEDIWTDGFDLVFDIDLSEMTPVYTSSGPNSGYDVDYAFGGSLFTDGGLVDEEDATYRISCGDLAGYTEIKAGETFTIATMHFDIIGDEFWDGLSDFALQLQDGNFGIGIYSDVLEASEIVNLNGANGPDVGSPVPVPAAVWLMGSGLLGLVGLRRKKS